MEPNNMTDRELLRHVESLENASVLERELAQRLAEAVDLHYRPVPYQRNLG